MAAKMSNPNDPNAIATMSLVEKSIVECGGMGAVVVVVVVVMEMESEYPAVLG